MKAILWIWIVCTAAWILIFPPFVEPLNETFWRNISSGELSVFSHRLLETRVDFSRMLAQILALNLIPSIILWKWDSLPAWIQKHGNILAWIVGISSALACTLSLAASLTNRPTKPSITRGLFDDLIPQKCAIISTAPTPNANFTLVPTWPAQGVQVKKAEKAKP